MNIPPQLIRDLGEQALLEKLQLFCPREIVGDDGALVKVTPKHLLVVTTDVLVDKVHFSDGTTDAISVGWRAAAANLSDLAAMGATPLGITVGLSLPGDVSVAWVESVYQGMKDCLQPYHTPILGGDISNSAVKTIAITALGEVKPERVISRRNARVGDAIVVTGYHGLSRAGLEILFTPEIAENLSVEQRDLLIKAHQKPQPRLDVLPHLSKIKGEVKIAGMDSSDGLADALVQICRCSSVGAEIDYSCLPILPCLSQLVSQEKILDWILYGGEDFQLVLALPLTAAEFLISNLGEDAAIIGKITNSLEVVLVDSGGYIKKRLLNMTDGFQHFSSSHQLMREKTINTNIKRKNYTDPITGQKIIGTVEAAEKLGICPPRMRQLLQEGRIKQAKKVDRFWEIPLFDNDLPEVIPGSRGPKGSWNN